jgi:glutathione peroxidase-family protein
MKLLIVNTASYCGYTPQFKQLEEIYAQYGGAHFAILGFPSDDFNQEPGNDSTINQFCDSIYDVTFQMMSKIHVIFPDTAPVYTWLQRKNLNGVKDTGVIWNFNKFLVDEAGHWVAYYSQLTLPNDTGIVNWINTPSIYTNVSDVALPIQFTSANPVNNELSFNLNSITPQKITVKLFSLNGKEVASVYEGNMSGYQSVNYNTANLSSGMYLMQVQSPVAVQTVKVVVAH